jgi:hypothetical protein
MSDKKKLDRTIAQIDSYVESWKQFNTFINLARAKKFSAEDEEQLKEVKRLLVQELEMILASFETPPINREDIHGVISSASSIRALSEMSENALRNLEVQWNKIDMTLNSILGQLKVQQQNLEGKSFWSSLFGGKKK